MNPELRKTEYYFDGESYRPEDPQSLSGWNDEFTVNANHDLFQEKIAEINSTWRIVKDKATGRTFEVAIANQDKLDDTAVLVTSTSFSSLTQNAGNAIELAAHAMASPEAARIYVAFFGNGGSQSLDRGERKYLASTGRFTRYNRETKAYEPVEALKALNRALHQNRLHPTHVSSDIEGGRFALGAMAALEYGTIKAAYLNGVPGISKGEKGYAVGMIEEDMGKGKAELSIGPDSWAVTGEFKQEVKEKMPNIYQGAQHLGLLAKTYVRAAPNLWMTRRAFGQPHDSPFTGHALLRDAVAALEQQNSRLVLQFNKDSSIYNIEDCKHFGGRLLDVLREQGRDKEADVSLLIGEGSLDRHTRRPRERWATERYALQFGE